MNAVTSETRAACCMLCVTATIVNSLGQPRHQLLDHGAGDRIERRRRLVHQQHLRLSGDGPRDAQPLLLSAREAQRARAQLIFHFVPKRGRPQRALGRLELLSATQSAARAGDGVVENRERRKRIRALKDHADAPPDRHRIDVTGVDVLTIEQHASLNARVECDFVNPVEAAQQRRLAAPRRTDQRSHRLTSEPDRNVADRFAIAVICAQIVGREQLVANRRRRDAQLSSPRIARRNIKRAPKLNTKTATIKRNAPAHACACQFG